MKTISSEIVEKTWKEVATTPIQEAFQLAKRLHEQQPSVSVYLLGVGGDNLNRDERELLFYLGVVVWQIMLQGDIPLNKITDKMLDEAEELNMKMLEYLEDESEEDFIKTAEIIIKNYNQPNVLKYVVEALMEEHEEDCIIRDENKGIM